jgi:hypothetical protein
VRPPTTDDDLDALAAINRALSSMGMTNLTHLNQDNNERRRRNNSRRIQQGNVRKTRLSWELHPILIDALDDDNESRVKRRLTSSAVRRAPEMAERRINAALEKKT